MLEKLMMITGFFVLALATDWGKLRAASRRGKWSYAFIVLCALYFSADYALDFSLPDLHWLADHILLGPAQAIVDSLKVKQL